MDERIGVVRHDDLSRTHLEQLRVLFDREYLDDYGPWTPDAPYGYSPADAHLLVTHGVRQGIGCRDPLPSGRRVGARY